MANANWSTLLQNAAPVQGFQPLPPATYRFRATAGTGKTAASGAQMVQVELEVASGPKAGKKVWHNWVLPADSSKDTAQEQMNRFLGAMEVFGLNLAFFQQNFANQEITKEHCDWIANHIVSTGVIFKAAVSLQKNDPSRNNINNFVADDGVEPAPPAEPKMNSAVPGGPGFPGAPGPGAANGMPLGGFPGSGGPSGVTSPPAFAGGGIPGAVPNPGQPQQYAPAAAAQPAPQGQFPGQQFPGQVDPANFPAQNQQAQPMQPAPGQFQPQAVQPQYGVPQGQPGMPGPGQQFAPPAAPQMPGMPGAQPQAAPMQAPMQAPTGQPGVPMQAPPNPGQPVSY